MHPFRLALAGALAVALLSPSALRAQSDAGAPGAKTPAAAPAEVSKDALGRDTPRGALLGFMRTARDGNDEAAAAYLNTGLRGHAAENLARQLYIVLDSRLPARLNEVSDRAEGGLANPLKPDIDVVGSINTASGPLSIVVERVGRAPSPRLWLFSRQTLDVIPDVYDEVNRVRVEGYVPRSLKIRIGGIGLFHWALFFLVVPLLYRLIGPVGRLANPIVARWRRRYPSTGTASPGSVPGFVRLLLLAVAIRWLLATLDLPLLERQLWSNVAAMFVMVAVVWMGLLANSQLERYLRRRLGAAGHDQIATPLRLVRRVADVLVLAAGGIVTLKFYGFDPTAALAGLGIGGIAVALAAQKTLENVIGGLSIIFDKAVRVGDFLKLGDLSGTVDYVGLRSTRIRTLDRTVLSVPNGQIANATIETLSSRDKFWFHHFFGLRYGTTALQMSAVLDGIQQRLGSHRSVEHESARARFVRVGPSSLDIELFAYLFADDWVKFLEIQEALLLDVMEIVERAGAVIAFPSQTLYFADANPFAPVTGGAATAAVNPRAR